MKLFAAERLRDGAGAYEIARCAQVETRVLCGLYRSEVVSDAAGWVTAQNIRVNGGAA
jgi:hypothetical protein